MSNQTELAKTTPIVTQKVDTREKPIEYTPYGGQDKIILKINLVRELLASPTKSGRKPSDNDCIKFIMLCQGKRLNPFEQDAYLVGYDTFDENTDTKVAKFSQITAHSALLKRAELHPDYDGMQSGVILLTESGVIEREGDFHLPAENLVGGWAKVYHKSKKIPTYRKLNLSVFNTNLSRWKKDPAGMIVKCAEADSLRSAFPSLNGGLYTREEMESLPNGEAQTALISHIHPETLAQLSDDQTPRGEGTEKTEGRGKKKSAPELSSQQELENLLTQEGINFTDFQKWAMDSGLVRGADSIGTWSEVEATDAVRLLRNQVGMITQIKKLKAQQ